MYVPAVILHTFHKKDFSEFERNYSRV